MNTHTPVNCSFCDAMPRKDRLGAHLASKHIRNIGLHLLEEWSQDKFGNILGAVNKGMTSVYQLQYIMPGNDQLRILFSEDDFKVFDDENPADDAKKAKLIKETNIQEQHYKFLTETCLKALTGFDVYKVMQEKVNNSPEMAELRKKCRELQKDLSAKPADEYDALKSKNEELEIEVGKLRRKLNEDYDSLYEPKYNEASAQLAKKERECQVLKNDIDNIHKRYEEIINNTRTNSRMSDEALLKDIAEWESRKKKDAGAVEKIEKEMRHLKDELKKKNEEMKQQLGKKDDDIKKYKKTVDKYKKQILKLMASKLEDSDDEESISSIAS